MKNSILNKAEGSIKKIAKIFNDIAGWAVVAAMLLVIVNILLRVIFKKPILGAYEYTGFITAIIVGFGIAFCLVLNAHISIDFITQKFPKTVQRILSIVSNFVMFLMMSAFTFYIFKYATKLLKSNSVSPTTQFPYYIFVYLVGICFIVLSLVLLIKIKNSLEAKHHES